ncbi:MAG: competence/damage-inducible protein A [Veillonella sp.]|nr:competence/damage-inducible protein A [Veillonella sp.]
MIVELISTGSELLLGDQLNTNVSWLAKEFNKKGYTIAYQSVVGDNASRMAEVFRMAQSRADLVVVTGGLGPTQGDITRQVLGQVTGLALEFNPEAMAVVEGAFARLGQAVPSQECREAILPMGSHVLDNPVGVAPGLVLDVDDTSFVLLPGPPAEMKGMVESSLFPYLDKRFGSQGLIHSHRYAIYGLPESVLESTLMDLVKAQSNPTIAFLIKAGYIELRLTAKAASLEEAEALLEPWDRIVHQRLEAHIGRSLDLPVEDLLKTLLEGSGKMIATAESCTSGLVGKRIGNTPGSSEYFNGGIISYSNEVKHHVLGVDQELLDIYGAVSEPVAKMMAEGAARVTNSTYAVSTTGIAGPGGGTPDKPVGLVWFGVTGPHGTRSYKRIFIGDRESIRQSAAESALYFLYEYIKEEQVLN